MLKSICIRCGATIPYGSRCPCRATDKRAADKAYDAFRRNKSSKAIYSGAAWQKVREVARARDNGLCLMCLLNNKIKENETVHHIVEVTEDASLIYEPDNLICLCNKCHYMVHRRYGTGKAEMQKELRGLIGSEIQVGD